LAVGWTNNVSMPSAAPISAVGAFLEGVANLLGRVKDRAMPLLLGPPSGVEGTLAMLTVRVGGERCRKSRWCSPEHGRWRS
jgi:hypothetical protein